MYDILSDEMGIFVIRKWVRKHPLVKGGIPGVAPLIFVGWKVEHQGVIIFVSHYEDRDMSVKSIGLTIMGGGQRGVFIRKRTWNCSTDGERLFHVHVWLPETLVQLR